VDDLFAVYDGRVPREADLVTYWFEKARAVIAAKKAKRAGLLATQGIRGGANRRVLERIKDSGDIFLAYSDRDWVLEGANVHVSIIGFDDGSEAERQLDGAAVQAINADLTSAADLTQARRLPENAGISFMGDTKGGAFDITAELAQKMLGAPANPNGRPNSDVLRPWINGLDVTRRPRGMWIVDFGCEASEKDAALYQEPFEYVKAKVRPFRAKNKRDTYRERWWIHAEPRPAMRDGMAGLKRYIATPRVSKHRLFVWEPVTTLPDSALIIFLREDDYFLGVLHSKPHELWARRMGTQVREAESGFRYTPNSTFETFPLPWPPGQEPAADPRVEAIATAARDLVSKRDAWLNPPGGSASELAKRTLTNLYNQRPTWLYDAHRALDQAVFAAYGWPANITDGDILACLLALNQQRAAGKQTKAAVQN